MRMLRARSSIATRGLVGYLMRYLCVALLLLVLAALARSAIVLNVVDYGAKVCAQLLSSTLASAPVASVVRNESSNPRSCCCSCSIIRCVKIHILKCAISDTSFS
jgi:hypothetical protein